MSSLGFRQDFQKHTRRTNKCEFAQFTASCVKDQTSELMQRYTS